MAQSDSFCLCCKTLFSRLPFCLSSILPLPAAAGDGAFAFVLALDSSF